MSMNLGKTNFAFARLLDMAGGRYDVVEFALMEASRLADGRAPSYDDVVRLLAKQKNKAEADAAKPPEMAGAAL